MNDPARSGIYTLSLHDALPISGLKADQARQDERLDAVRDQVSDAVVRQLEGEGISTVGQIVVSEDPGDRKSTRLNSSHVEISYAVFCLKKKKKRNTLLPCGLDC